MSRYFLPSLSAISIDNRKGRWDGQQGGVGWGGEVAKTTVWDTLYAAMMPTQWPIAYQWAT